MNEKTRPKVLIVDDESANLNLLWDTLEPEGYEVLAASNGEAALRIATSELPDIILLDVVMPGMDGYEVCRRLKQDEATRNIPVLFVTIREESESVIKGFQAGGVDYINKPFEKAELLVRIENHLKISRLTHEVLQKNQELERKNIELRQEMALREQAEDELKAERELRKLREFTEIIFNNINDSISIVDATTFKIVEVNQAFVNRSKLKVQDIIGKDCHDINHFGVKGDDTCPIGETLRTGRHSSAEHIHYDKDGRKIYVEVAVYPITNDNGEIDKVIHIARDITARKQTEEALQKADEQLSMLSQQEASRWGIAAFVGKSKTIQKILGEVRQLQSVKTTNVLITGESGTGKELIARAIHFGSDRAKSRFIPINCSALPAELVESTLFGHLKGAFTGANSTRKGYFELADGGTLFLDEIGDMPIELQPKLLRVIEDGCIMPVGGAIEKRVDVRIIAATNQNLAQKIAQGLFREDLYFRLERFHVTVPPLRERKEDIPLLTAHFLKMFATDMGIEHPSISPESLSALEAHYFSGNVRELKNIIEGALIKSGGSIIQPEHLHFIDLNNLSPAQTPPLDESQRTAECSMSLEQIEALVIQRAQRRKAESVDLQEHSASPLITDEEKILVYLREHGSISNAECQDFLNVDLNRASYVLRKMHRYGLLVRDGERRWSRYRLPLIVDC
ncbi:sigma-54-dependent Fis family transcriptional regulator [Candidatus Poribacteria bacterium]|nr:sigma-54-dependent Fis family transcriptional regulator [Candidatus Poribacteria bacterium]